MRFFPSLNQIKQNLKPLVIGFGGFAASATILGLFVGLLAGQFSAKSAAEEAVRLGCGEEWFSWVHAVYSYRNRYAGPEACGAVCAVICKQISDALGKELNNTTYIAGGIFAAVGVSGLMVYLIYLKKQEEAANTPNETTSLTSP